MFRKISFTPAVTSCYQEHALNADVRYTYLRPCYATLSKVVPKPRCCSLYTALNIPRPTHGADDITLVIQSRR